MHKTNKNGPFDMACHLRHIHGLGVVALVLLGLAITPTALAQNSVITTIAKFSSAIGPPSYGGLIQCGTNLYGTSFGGGANNCGTVFSVPIKGGKPKVIATFNGMNGSNPDGRLVLIGSTLYGITVAGGPKFYNSPPGGGTVFSVPISGGIPKVIASFNRTNGSNPGGGLTLYGKNFYGTTEYGGVSCLGGSPGHGTVFSVPIRGGIPVAIANFNGINGSEPNSGVILIGRTLYGTTFKGGPTDSGIVFSVPLSGGTPAILGDFKSSDASSPGSLTLSGTTLYGPAYSNGANQYGEIFSVPITGGTPSVIASFHGRNGRIPSSALTLIGSTLYGTTMFGGVYDKGVVFSVPKTGGKIAVFATFNGKNGHYPNGGLTLIGSTLYGTTESGVDNDSRVFSVQTISGHFRVGKRVRRQQKRR